MIDDNLPDVASPPLAPTLTDDQFSFIRLLQLSIRSSDYVNEWRHLFQGAMIRATTVSGKRATLARNAVQELVDADLLRPSHSGDYSFYLTDAGRLV